MHQPKKFDLLHQTIFLESGNKTASLLRMQYTKISLVTAKAAVSYLQAGGYTCDPHLCDYMPVGPLIIINHMTQLVPYTTTITLATALLHSI